MGKKIRDIEGKRWIEIDAKNALIPASVFLVTSAGIELEFDLCTFIDALRDEFGFLEPVATGAARFLMTGTPVA